MTKFLRISIFIGILTFLVYNPGLAANFEITGIQSGVWSLDRSPYIVAGDVLVPNGLILKIEAGVVVKFAGNYLIRVEGGLIATGNKSKPIVFTSVSDKEFGKNIINKDKIPQPSDWKGIEFLDDCDDYLTILNHCIIRYSNWGIRCTNSLPLITNIMLVDNERCSLRINNQEYAFEPGLVISPITQTSRPSISPLPEPAQENDLENVKRLMELQKQKIEQQHLRALQDSIRRANKIKPIDSKTGRITLEREVFEQFNVQSINSLMSYLPGFVNLATIWTGYQLTSRGIAPTLASNRFLFQVNSVPIYEPGARTNYWEFIPLEAIDRIEIDRGIVFSQFNHHGVIASANFIPRYSTTGMINKSNIECGEFGSKKLMGFLGLNRDSTFINLSTNFVNNAGYWRTFSQGEAGEKFRQKYASDLYNFSLCLKHSSLNLFTSYFEHDQFQLGLIPQLQYTSPTHRRGLVVSLNKEINILPQLLSRIAANYVHSYERSEISNSESSGSTELADADHFISKGHLLSVASLTQYKQPNYVATAGITVSQFMMEPLFGIKHEENEFIKSDNWGTSSKISEYEGSGFIGLGYNFSPFLGFDGKIYIHFTDNFNRPDFSVDAKIVFNPFLPFDSYFRYTRAMRAATLLEKKIYFPDLLHGNASLKNEKFEQWEWSTDVHIRSDLKFGFVAYYINNWDLIQLNPDYHFTNNKKTFWTTGYEFMIQGKLTDKFFLLTNAAYDNVRYSGWCYPKLKINGLARIQWFPNFSTITTFQYLSQLNTDEKFGPYYLMHLSLVYQVLPQIKVAFNGFDLLDQHPRNPEYIRGEIAAIPVSPGRAFYISMIIEWLNKISRLK